jgi:hypothetical protein
VICISNGLIPDLGALGGLNGEKTAPEPLVSFSYDNTLEETDGAMKTFQQHYSGKRGMFSVIAYALLTCAVIVAVILNPTSIFAYVALIFCALGLFYSLTDKKRTRKKTLEALKDMNPEEYKASIFDDKIELETIIKPKANEVNLKIDEEADEEIISPLKSVFVFGDDLLNFEENDESLLLIFNRRQIYCFPKRCLNAQQIEKVRNILTEKLG